MALTLYAHPFSSYSQKVLIALWERDVAFTYRHLEAPGAAAERAALWPLGRFPVLVDDGKTIVESSIIIEHLDLHHAGAPRMVPEDSAQALDVRFMDRFFDNYIMEAMQRPILETLRKADGRRETAMAEAGVALDTAYGWLETWLAGRTWGVGERFSMADCAAAPSLFYADWVHPIGERFPLVRAYRSRLLAWPPVARAVEEGRPYRGYFPLGAPDRD